MMGGMISAAVASWWWLLLLQLQGEVRVSPTKGTLLRSSCWEVEIRKGSYGSCSMLPPSIFASSSKFPWFGNFVSRETYPNPLFSLSFILPTFIGQNYL
ncbi:hypothetical protein MtrunA17_Chr3g0144671 [Medicago truncatula]|uniref:Transmembrane protein n=1 Tax=Medicago truncatula TaxID=3880 RepID=A0A396IZV6_MEDTR|nr:hypothetical protein MtrunA17_Chr3g0144671 [Medicago truncatula]